MFSTGIDRSKYLSLFSTLSINGLFHFKDMVISWNCHSQKITIEVLNYNLLELAEVDFNFCCVLLINNVIKFYSFSFSIFEKSQSMSPAKFLDLVKSWTFLDLDDPEILVCYKEDSVESYRSFFRYRKFEFEIHNYEINHHIFPVLCPIRIH